MKKPFNWGGYTLICIYLLGLFFFGLGIYQCKTNPQSAIVEFFGAGSGGAVIALALFGGFFFVLGGIFVILLFKIFDMKVSLKASPVLTAPVKVVSKVLGANHHKMSYSGREVLWSYTFSIVCEFQNGSRKNFRVKNIEVYNTILENDTGILTYKEHGKHTLFIDFQRSK